MATTQNQKVNVKGGHYVGKKWFIKIAYKTIETDVEFFDDNVTLSQGSGFARANYKTPTCISYSNISTVTTKRKISTPNIVFAIICAILAVASQIWAVLIVSAFSLFMGSTAMVTINLGMNNTYEIPTEFMSDAEELQTKINTAISQSKE